MPALSRIQLCIENQGKVSIIQLINFDRISSIMNLSAMLAREGWYEENNIPHNYDRESVL